MASTAKYSVKVNDKEFELETLKSDSKAGTLGGKEYKLDLIGDEKRGFSIIQNNQSHNVQVLEADYETKIFTLKIGNGLYQVEAADRFDLLLKQLGMEHMAAGALGDLKAPMPGKVLDVKIKPGDSISKGDPVLVLEAMKMENVLKAEADAVIKAVHCEKGIAVEKNQVLIEFED